MDDEHSTETTSLLGSTQQTPSLALNVKRPNHWHLILSVVTIQLLLNIARCIAIAPDTSILMDIVCRQYYATAEVDSRSSPVVDRCKASQVQSEVAYIHSWRYIIEFLPGILFAVPYGALADRIGRKKVLFLAILGCFMSDVWLRLVYWFPSIFPVRASCLGGMFYVIGAGGSMMGSIQYVMIADVCPAELRATAFAWVQSALLLAQSVFVPVGGALIARNPWIPMFISSGFMILGLLGTVVFLPETLSPAVHGDHESLRLPTETNRKAKVMFQLQELLASLASFCLWLHGNMRKVMVLLCFFFFALGQQENSSLLLQYAYKRFNWSLGEASYLFSLSAGTAFVVLTVLIPAASSLLRQRWNLREAAKDKLIAQISGSFLSAGSGLIFLTASGISLVIGQLLVSLGSAFGVLAKSVVASTVEQKHLATIFTFVSVLSSLGSLIGAPLLAYAFQQGMKLGGVWVGIPFLIACGCFVLALLAISVASTSDQGGVANGTGPDAGNDGNHSAAEDALHASS